MIANLVFLRLSGPDVSQSVEACVTNAAGEIIFSGPARLAELGGYAEGRRVIATLPGCEAVSLRATLPPMPQRQIARALPYAIEDRLIDDVATLHLAQGAAVRSDSGLVVPVEVIARERIDAACSALEAAGLHPSALYVDAAVLGDDTESRVWLDGDEVHVRDSKGERTSLPRAAWEIWQQATSEGERAKPITAPQDDPLWIPRRLLEGAAVNLLQGDFAARAAPSNSLWPRWRWVAAFAAVVVVLQIIIVLLARLDARSGELDADAQLIALAQPALPIGGDADDALTLIRSAATGVSSSVDAAAGSTGFALLSLLAQRAPAIELSAISSEADRAELVFSRLEATDATALQETLRAAGWTVEAEASSAALPRWRLSRANAP